MVMDARRELISVLCETMGEAADDGRWSGSLWRHNVVEMEAVVDKGGVSSFGGGGS